MLTLVHAWSRSRKWLILASILLVLIALTATVYVYERYYREPGLEILYGTWEVPEWLPGDPEPVYLQLRRDGTFSLSAASDGQLSSFLAGRWYAGGTIIYLRIEGEQSPRRPALLRIVDIQAEELQVRGLSSGVSVLRRAHFGSPNASNQAMQRTAGRAVF